MEKLEINYTIYRGDDVALSPLIFEHSEGVPVDLTGYRLDLHAVSHNDTVLTLSSETGEIQIEPAIGRVTINIPRKLTKDASWRKAKFDLQLTDQQGLVETPVFGTIQLTQDITP